MKYHELIITNKGEDSLLSTSFGLTQLKQLKKQFEPKLKPGFKIRIDSFDTSKIKKSLSNKDISNILSDIDRIQNY